MDVSAPPAPAVRLLLIRHAHTDMAGRFCGQIDPPLSIEGQAQLAGINQRLDDIRAKAPCRLAQIFSSDLLRTRQTAEAIAASTGTSVQLMPALREISFGRWDGLNWQEIEARDPAYADRWAREFPNLPAPDGENFTAFRERITRAVRQIAEQISPLADTRVAVGAPRPPVFGERGPTCVVVTHAGVIRTLLYTLLALPAESLVSIPCAYGSVHEILYSNGRWSLPESL
jgi:broad specificity phosphatase PhoE